MLLVCSASAVASLSYQPPPAMNPCCSQITPLGASAPVGKYQSAGTVQPSPHGIARLECPVTTSTLRASGTPDRSTLTTATVVPARCPSSTATANESAGAARS